jgi:hypothetical protein
VNGNITGIQAIGTRARDTRIWKQINSFRRSSVEVSGDPGAPARVSSFSRARRTMNSE